MNNNKNEELIMVVFNQDNRVVIAGRPRKLTAQECRDYMQPGWEVKTMSFKEYKDANYKWDYDKSTTNDTTGTHKG